MKTKEHSGAPSAGSICSALEILKNIATEYDKFCDVMIAMPPELELEVRAGDRFMDALENLRGELLKRSQPCIVPLPEGVTRTNGGQRCDVSAGPCACGAWHDLPQTVGTTDTSPNISSKQ